MGAMRGVTIDKLDIKTHERYAQDQRKLDPKYIREALAIGSQPEISGTSVIYPSQWEILFDLQIKNIPWATFCPPHRYSMQAKRFFSYRILPSICLLDDSEEEEGEDDTEEQRKKRNQFIKKIINAAKPTRYHLTDFENEKTTLLNLLKSIKQLDTLLGQINSKKRQYQKG